MTQENSTATLTSRLNAYCDANGLPHDSADELAMRDDITPEQRRWLIDFVDEWDSIMAEAV